MDDQDHTTNKTIPDDKAMMDQAALASFVDKLIEERKDPNVTEASKLQVKAMLLSELNEAINTHLINRLSEKDQLALDDLLNTNPSDDDLNKFFMDTVPNLEVEIASALLNFRTAYLTPIGGVANIPPPPPPPPPPAPVNEG